MVMENNYISEPTEFVEAEINMGSINFGKTFDLHGTNNDEMLRLYLRKAGLSDAIECLSPEQRRAFIYDIIKSNKMPGYWRPSTMRTTAFTVAPPSVRPPPPPQSSSSSSRLNSLADSSPSPTSPDICGVVQHRFVAPPAREIVQPAAPPSPTHFENAKKLKGRVIEISGPVSFKHVSGDMTRDLTKNAFDLQGPNDNVLKKYMIERGITEEDIRGMKKQDVIKKIIHSNYTWMPPKRATSIQPKINYATISTNNEITPPSSPDTFSLSSQASSVASKEIQQVEPNFSRFAAMSNRFADPSEFPSPDAIFNETPTSSPVTVPMAPPATGTMRHRKPAPAPPPRKPKPQIDSVSLPPPSAVSASQSSLNVYQTQYDEPSSSSFDQDLYAQVNKRNTRKSQALSVKKPIPPPPPPQMFSSSKSGGSGGGPVPPAPPPEMFSASTNGGSGGGSVPPPPPPQMFSASKSGGSGGGPVPPPPPPPPMTGGGPIPPPPPPPMAGNKPMMVLNAPTKTSAPSNGGDPRDALLESIRNGIQLKKVDKKAATISGVKPRNERKPPPMDFLSELKMGLTLRRVKNPQDNPCADEHTDEESYA